MSMIARICAVLALAAVSSACECKFKENKFKFEPVDGSESVLGIRCQAPQISDGCASVTTNCTIDNKVGEITAMKFSVHGTINGIPVNMDKDNICQDWKESSGGKDSETYKLHGLPSSCQDMNSAKLDGTSNLTDEEKQGLPKAEGSHKYTMCFENINGDKDKKACYKVSGYLKC